MYKLALKLILCDVADFPPSLLFIFLNSLIQPLVDPSEKQKESKSEEALKSLEMVSARACVC